jgi:hypothetical protein
MIFFGGFHLANKKLIKIKLMKTFKLSIIILLFFVFQLSNAQNWHLIEKNKTYHYSCDTTNLIFSLWADSIKINGGDTTWFANRIILPCDTCHAENYPNTNANKFMLKNQPLFLQREITLSEYGKIYLQSPDSFVIKMNNAINEPWNYSHSKTANIYYRGISTILGVQDSIIGILLNSSDTIIISKNYGVVQYPCVTGKYFRLIGVEGENSVGYQVPSFNEIYDFEIGDIIITQYHSKMWSDEYYYHETLLITDKIYDSIGNFKYKVCGCGEGFNFYYPDMKNLADTITELIDPKIYFSNIFSKIKTFQEIKKNHSDEPLYIQKVYRKDGLTYFEQEPNGFLCLDNFENADLDTNILFTSQELFYYYNEVSVIEKWGVSNSEYGFESYKGYSSSKSDIESPEDVVCDYCFLSSNNFQQKQFQIFPNPTTGIINISGVNVENIEVFNVFGQKVFRKSFSNSANNETLKIDLKNYLSNGIYFVNIQSKNKNYTSKLIVN